MCKKIISYNKFVNEKWTTKEWLDEFGFEHPHDPLESISLNEYKLAGKLLEIASDVFKEDETNFLDEKFFKGWSNGEREKFTKDYCQWSGQDYDRNNLRIRDSSVMEFLAAKLKNKK